MGCTPEPQVSHPTHAGTTYHWRRPRSWLAASLCQTGCWARCRFHRHFGICGENGMVITVSQATSSCPSCPLPGLPHPVPIPSPCPRPAPFQQGRRQIIQSFRSQTAPPICQSPKPAFYCFRHHGPSRERAGCTEACPALREQWLTVRGSRSSPEDSEGGKRERMYQNLTKVRGPRGRGRGPHETRREVSKTQV